MKATLTRAGTSVTLPLVSDATGQPVAVRGHGKPNLQIKETGGVNPRFSDNWSGLESHTLVGRLTGNRAYGDAIILGDLIKEYSNGDPLFLDIDSPEYESNIMVAPAGGQQTALTLSYPPGNKDVVIVDLSLTRVSRTKGEPIDTYPNADTPAAFGDGPLTLSSTFDSVDLVKNITVDRSVGRPNSVIRRTSTERDPDYVDKAKSTFDEFELSVQFTENSAAKIDSLVDMVRPRLDTPLSLNFNGLYGMGAMNVVPPGSEAIRFTRNAGQNGISIIPKITLRRVQA